MGYRSNFTLTFYKKDNTEFTNEDAKNILNEIDEIEGDHYVPDYTDTSIKSATQRPFLEIHFEEIKWYEAKSTLSKLMERHPDWELSFNREGDERDDTENIVWRNSQMIDCSPFVINPPIVEENSVLVAYRDIRDNGNLVITIVPETELQKKLDSLTEAGKAPVVINFIELFQKRISVDGCEERKVHLEDEVNNIIRNMAALRNSKFWIFQSPAPSSTEAAVLRKLKSAQQLLEEAAFLAKKCR